MATDYAEMEREFLAGLEADTGHDLAGWMTLIEAQHLPHRNDIIDWLRLQGFSFSWASWLERIHHNGGRPIYNGAQVASPSLVSAAAIQAPAPPAPSPAPPPVQQPAATPQAVPRHVVTPQSPAPTAQPTADLLALLAKAKAYRPLAEHLIREATRALPGLAVSARGGAISLARPGELAVLAVSGRELRLGLALGDEPGTAELPAGRMSGTLAAVSHVISLTDARQVNAGLLAALKRADALANPA